MFLDAHRHRHSVLPARRVRLPLPHPWTRGCGHDGEDPGGAIAELRQAAAAASPWAKGGSCNRLSPFVRDSDLSSGWNVMRRGRSDALHKAQRVPAGIGTGVSIKETSGSTAECPFWVCAVTRRRFPVGASPTRQPLQPQATGAGMEATKCLKPSGSGSRIGDRASVQATTRVNAEQASKRTMCRPTRQPFRGRLTRMGEMSEEYAQLLHRGSGCSMYTRKAHATRETPTRDQG